MLRTLPTIIFFVLVIIAIGFYVFSYIKRLFSFYGLLRRNKPVTALLVILTIIITAMSVNIMSVWGIVVLHFIVIAGVLDIVAVIAKQITVKSKMKEKPAYGLINKIYRCGIIPLLITIILMGYGYSNMTNIVETSYQIETSKNIRSEGYKVLLLTDIHYDTVQDTNILKSAISNFNKMDIDFVVLGGDIVEEGTSYKKMQEVFRILAGIHTHFGVYYVYGNHDRQPYTENRTYTDEQLDNTIASNGIKILKDTYWTINDEIVLAGRDDAAWGNTRERAKVSDILKNAHNNKYIIMADHQPIEAEENNNQGVDLELSGHTHAGQIWPVGYFNYFFGTPNYGEYAKGNMKLIVSSGVAGWKYPVRTGNHCEYVVIDIKSK